MGGYSRSLLPAQDSFKNKPTKWLQRIHIDGWLLLLLCLLAVYGLIILYSASGRSWDSIAKQVISFGVGLTVMVAVAQIEQRDLARFIPVGYALGLFMLLLVQFFGYTAMGATRWIDVPGLIRFQPSEFMKILMPGMLAWYLSKTGIPPRFLQVSVCLLLLFMPFVLIFVQPDLGTSVLVLISGAFVLFLGGLSWWWIISAIAISIPTMFYMWYEVLREYQKNRIKTFLDPESAPLAEGWNILQAKAAIGSGGAWGKGWMQGTQSHLEFLPESHTDFVLGVLAEELGLAGVVLLIALYVMVVARGLYITLHAQTIFGKLLAGSLSMTFFIYVFINIGMVSGLLPVVGVPLPFISMGGTSLVTLMAGFGVLMSIHTHRKWMVSTS